MEGIRIVEGRRYPVKSCRPEVFGEGKDFHIGPNGPVGDREFMVIDADTHEHRTQRRKAHPGYERLALVQPTLTDETLVLRAPGILDIHIPLQDEVREKIQVCVWGDLVDARHLREGSLWFSEFLGQHCFLVQKEGPRLINRDYASHETQVSFADRNQVLGISLETIERFKKRLGDDGETVSAANFRPNILFDGCSDREENNIDEIETGSVHMKSTVPCLRCEMPGNNPMTAGFNKRILRLLAKEYKPHRDMEPIFGEQFSVLKPGIIRIGNPIHVLKTRENGWARKF